MGSETPCLGERGWEMAALPAPHACGFCQESGRWPGLCPGVPADDFCLEEVGYRHELGDHRRCAPQDCDAFALIAEVGTRGADHARQSGKPYAVVNTFATPWEFRAFDRLQQAKPYRSRVGKAGLGRQDAYSIEFKTHVFVVSADGTVL